MPVCPCGFAVDTLRSCYQTVMRFPGVGLIPVRWFFTDKPPLPFATVYSSNNWSKQTIADLDADTGEPGEIWTAPRPWRDGRAPDLGTCTGPQGTPAAWLGLTDSTSPLFQCGKFGAPYNADYGADYDSAAGV